MCHIGNLLLVSITTIWPKSGHNCASGYRISSKSEHPLQILRHIHFSGWWLRPLNTTIGFVFVDVTAFRRSKSTSKPNLSRYLNWWLRYNYFRFLKTNIRHIGILLPVLISTISPQSVCFSASGYRSFPNRSIHC